jgi:hypothetical protein
MVCQLSPDHIYCHVNGGLLDGLYAAVNEQANRARRLCQLVGQPEFTKAEVNLSKHARLVRDVLLFRFRMGGPQ